MNILDDAFDFAKGAFAAEGHAEAKARLQSKYPDVEWDDLVESYLKACALAEACYDFGDKCREEKITDAEAIIQMRKMFPGFSEDTYNAALSHGWFISR